MEFLEGFFFFRYAPMEEYLFREEVGSGGDGCHFLKNERKVDGVEPWMSSDSAHGFFFFKCQLLSHHMGLLFCY